jgi:hypothetical protein
MAVQSPLRKVFRSVFSNTFNLTVNFLSRIGGGSVVTYLSRLLTSSTTTPFYSGTTNIVDSSATGDYREIQPGRCLDFNGTTQSINLIDQNINIPFVDGTYSVWFYADVASADKFIDQNTGGRIGFGTGAGVNALSMYCSIGGSTSTADAYVPLKWHHCVWVLENQTRALYVNGELLQTFAAGYPTTFTGGRIGAIYNDTGNHFDGKLFDFRFYTRALTNDEITAIYRQGLQPDSIVEGQPDATNLVGRWLLDDNSETTAYDSSGNGNHGTIVGYASEMLYEGDDVPYSAQNLVGWSPLTGFSNDVPEGLSGNSYRFDGIDDWIQVGDPVSLRPLTPTVSLWFKVNGLDHMHTMFCSPSNGTNNGFMLRVQNSDNKIKAFIDANGWKSVSSNEVVELNKWTHAAMTYDGSILKLYVNGVLQSDSASFTHSSWSVPISVSGFIGRYHNVVEFYRLMKGMVKDVRVYNTGLTQDNISFLANGSGVNPGSANLVGHWELDGDLTESSGNADLSTATAVGNNGEILSRDESTPANDVLGNTLQYTGTVPKYATPVDAPCLTFDGTTQYVDCGDAFTFYSATGDKPFRIASRVNIDTFTVTRPIISKYSDVNGGERQFAFEVDSSARLRLFVFDDSSAADYLLWTSQSSLSVNTDYLLEVSYDGNASENSVKLYINGELQNVTFTRSGNYVAMAECTESITVGSRSKDNVPFSGFFDGKIWDIKVYGDSDGINLIFWTPFSEGDGNTVYDVVNGNSYTITSYVSTMWDNTQDQFFYSFENGCRVDSGVAIPALADGSAAADGNPLTGLPGLLNSDSYNLNLLPEPDAPYQRSAIPGATFDGVGDSVSVNNVDWDFTEDFEYEITAYLPAPTNQFLIGSATSFNIGVSLTPFSSQSGLRFQCGGTTANVNKFDVLGAIYAIDSVNVIKFEFESATGNVKATVNGTEYTGNLSGPSGSSQIALGIRRQSDNFAPFAGRIDRFYYSSAATSVEYDFRENNGLVIPDRSGNGNDGTLVVNSSLSQIFAPTVLETAYTLGDGRTRPHYVTVDSPNETDFRTEII